MIVEEKKQGNFAAALRRRCRQSGKRKKKIAQDAGIVPQHLWRLETGQHMPTLTTLHKLAAALHCSVKDLLV